MKTATLSVTVTVTAPNLRYVRADGNDSNPGTADTLTKDEAVVWAATLTEAEMEPF